MTDTMNIFLCFNALMFWWYFYHLFVFVSHGVFARESFYYCIIPYVFGMGFYYSCFNLLAFLFEDKRKGEGDDGVYFFAVFL